MKGNGCDKDIPKVNSPEIKDSSKPDSPEINELICELSSCRDDERNNTSQLTQFVVAAWTVLMAAFALGQLSGFAGNLVFQLLTLSLTVFVLSALCAFIISTGVISSLRHHYIIYLEDRLTDCVAKCNENGSGEQENLLHWTSFSKSIITLNKQSIKAGYSKHYYASMVIAVFSVLFLGLIFIGVQVFKFDFSKISLEVLLAVILLTLVIVAVAAYGIYMFFYATQKSKKFFDYAKSVSLDQRANRKNEADKNNVKADSVKNPEIQETVKKKKSGKPVWVNAVLYFIYPRFRDVQKIIFVILGFIFGCLAVPPDASTGGVFFDLRAFGLTILITELLVYQARYQWNDIRGLSEDRTDREVIAKDDKGLPMFFSKTSYAPAIITSIVIMLLKLYAAFFLLIPCYVAQQQAMMYCNLAVLILAVLYEFCRSHTSEKWGNAIIILVGLGYPLRFFTGLLAARPALVTELHLSEFFGGIKNAVEAALQWLAKLFYIAPAADKPIDISGIVLIAAASMAMFGIAFVTLAWVLRAVMNVDKEKKKPHYTILLKGIPDKTLKYPLMPAGIKITWWNITYILSAILLSCAQYILCPSVWSALIAVVPAVCAVVYSFYPFKNKKGTEKNNRLRNSIIISVCYLIIVFMFVRIPLQQVSLGLLYILIAVMQVIYAIVYNAFRHSNYDELYNSLSLMFARAVKFVLDIIIGKETLKTLYEEKTDK